MPLFFDLFLVRPIGETFETEAELVSGFAVTEETERANVVEVALASTFGYRTDVVGVPEALAGGDGFHAIETEACSAS